MYAYAVFQGGGAKGYAHVGALKAAEERNIHFRKVAGTSAGAIVAALSAAGYSADEIYNPDAPPGSRGVFEIPPTELLNPAEYKIIKALGEKIERFKSRRNAAKQEPRTLWERVSGALFRSMSRGPWGVWLMQAGAIISAWGRLNPLFRTYGLTDTQLLEQWIDELLAHKTGITGRRVNFADLGMRLRVIAANLTRGELRAFGEPDDAQMPVAVAVAASACYPLFFRPVAVDGELYVDGGLVSNLPAWVFDDDRDSDEAFLPTFGFRLVDTTLSPGEPENPDSAVSFARRLFQTTLSGAPALEQRAIPDYYGIDLDAPIETLSFESLSWRAPQLVEAGRASVRSFFQERIGPQDPERMRIVLRVLLGQLREWYDDWREDDRLRARILLPEPNGRRARTTYSAGTETDGDDRLSIRIGGLGLGTCFERREPIYINHERVSVSDPKVNKLEMTARPSAIRYTYVIPIFDDPAEWLRKPSKRQMPFAVLAIDKSRPIDTLLQSYVEQDVLANAAAIIGEELHGRPLARSQRAKRRDRPGQKGFINLDSEGAFQVSRRKIRDLGETGLGERLGREIARLGAGRFTAPLTPVKAATRRRRSRWRSFIGYR